MTNFFKTICAVNSVIFCELSHIVYHGKTDKFQDRKICYVSQGKDRNFFDIKEVHFLSSSYKLFTVKSSSINNQATGQMNINFIIVMCAACVSSARLGFNGSKYHYSQFRNFSPQQAAIIKHLLKQKCLRKYGPRFC